MSDYIFLLGAVGAGIMAGLIWRRSHYPRNVLWARDVEINAATGGEPKQTISDTVGDGYRAGRWWARGLNVLMLGHFKATNEAGRTREGFFATSRGLFLMLVAVSAWYYARWRWPVVFVRQLESPFMVLLIAWLLTQQVLKAPGTIMRGLRMSAESNTTVPWIASTAGLLIMWLMKVGIGTPRWVVIAALSVLAFLMFMLGWHFFGG